jgi:hypothetical protein
MLGGAQGGRWARERETYTFQDHGSLEIRRAIWNATNFGLLGSYRLARSFDVLDEYLARLLEIEATILGSLEVPRRQPLFEVAQGLYVIARVPFSKATSVSGKGSAG